MTLPKPEGRQREVLTLPAVGHTVVLGTAGSGKTTLAIHRAIYLANPIRNDHGRTLLVTFNRALVTYLRHLNPGGPGTVDVRNYHHFARGYLSSRGLLEANSICGRDCRKYYVERSVSEVNDKREDHPIFNRPVDFFLDEFSWLAGHGIRSAEEYVDVERVGRSRARLQRADRPLVFSIYQRYKELRQEGGKRYDWDDLAMAVSDELARDDSPRMYRHVVIDEGQDFSPEMVRSLVRAVPDEGSVTFFGDAAQQIYGAGVPWKSAGLEVQKVWEFEENYRNTKQVARLALAIADMPHFKDVPDLVEPKQPTADGPRPTLVKLGSPDDELEFAIEQARAVAERDRVAILFRTRRHEARIRQEFPDAIRLHRDMKTWDTDVGVRYGTYFSAKGLEFDTVIMPLCGEDFLPYPSWVVQKGPEEAAVRDAKLVYVGVTRAKVRLIITFSGSLTDLLPREDHLYEVVQL